MHDRTLIALSLAVSALGIIGLLLALATMEPEETQDIGALADGAPALVRGTVSGVRSSEAMQVLTLDTRTRVEVALFDGNASVREGQCVEVRGKKGSYDGKPQVVASRITACAAQ